MKHRKLRIAWSVMWAVVAVLLIALWVRSYWRLDALVISSNRALASVGGELETLVINQAPAKSPRYLISGRVAPLLPPMHAFMGFGYEPMPVIPRVVVPYWFPILISGAVIALPWTCRTGQFTLRTLLIATTLVAIGLGLIVWTAR